MESSQQESERNEEKPAFEPQHVLMEEKPVRSACEEQTESRPDTGQLVVTTYSDGTAAAEEEGSGLSVEDGAHGDSSAAVTHTSCSSALLCQKQQVGRGREGTQATKSRAGRAKKNRKRNNKSTRHATESQENSTNTQGPSKGNTQSLPETGGSGMVSPTEQPAASVINIRSPQTQETPLPIKPASGPVEDGKCVDRKAVASPLATTAEKQEGQKWEVELRMCKTVTVTGVGAPTEHGDTKSLLPGEAQESGAERTVIMGQDQSRDPKVDRPRSDGPNQQDSTSQSPQPGLRTSTQDPDLVGSCRDSGWIGSRMESSPRGANATGKTVWYQGENVGQDSAEVSSVREENSQTVWYSDMRDEGKSKQLEQGMALSHSQLWERGLQSHQAAAAGAQSARSHGPEAQRREVHGSQRGEEAGLDLKEGGMREGGIGEASYGSKSSEAVDNGEGEEEKGGSGEKSVKGRRRRRKRGKGGGEEGRLSSSSSVDSYSQTEVQAGRGQAPRRRTKDRTGRDDIQSGDAPELVREEGVDQEAMHLPGQMEIQTKNSPGADGDTSSGLCEQDRMRTDLTEVTIKTECCLDSEVIPSELCSSDDGNVAVEVFEPAELGSEVPTGSDQQTPGYMEAEVLSHSEDLNVAGEAVTSKSSCPEETSDHREPTADVLIVETPKQETLETLDSNDPVDSAEPTASPVGSVSFVDPTEAASLPFEDCADMSPLYIQEGNVTSAVECSEHCFASELLGVQQHKEGKRDELQQRSQETSVEEDESDGDKAADREEQQRYAEELAAAAVAVVTVAIASAVAGIQVSQLLADGELEHSQSASEDVVEQLSVDGCALPTLAEDRPAAQVIFEEPATVGVPEEESLSGQMDLLPAGLLSSEERANSDLLVPVECVSSAQSHSAELQPETPEEEDSPLTGSTADRDGHDHTQMDVLLDTQSPPSSLVVDMGQVPDDCLSENSGEVMLSEDRETGHGQKAHDGGDESDGMSATRCQPDDSQSQLARPCQGEIPGFLLGCGTPLPVSPSDAADPTVEEAAADGTPERGETALLQMADVDLVAESPHEGDTSHGEALECVVTEKTEEDGLDGDTVDTWKDRGGSTVENEARKEMGSVEDASHAETSVQEERDSDSPATLQIRRETEVFYPVPTSFDPGSVTPCTGVHLDSVTCVCGHFLHRDTVAKEELNGNAELDGVFKKPKDPPPCIGLGNRQVHVSCFSSDDVPMQTPFSPNKGTLIGGPPDTVAPQCSRLSQKSEMENRETQGGETEGAADEEEKKQQLPESPASSASIHSVSPFHRHSWEPGGSSTVTHFDLTQDSSPKIPSGEVKRTKTPLHRRSMSWCPSNWYHPDQEHMDNRSYSLYGLEVETSVVHSRCLSLSDREGSVTGSTPQLDSHERGSVVSLTEKEHDGDSNAFHTQADFLCV
ncbi:uncharacterized protein KZ484_008707 [Pholidichthys leucotaenia]